MEPFKRLKMSFVAKISTTTALPFLTSPNKALIPQDIFLDTTAKQFRAPADLDLSTHDKIALSGWLPLLGLQ